jgi:hypothetical protein
MFLPQTLKEWAEVLEVYLNLREKAITGSRFGLGWVSLEGSHVGNVSGIAAQGSRRSPTCLHALRVALNLGSLHPLK